VVSVDESRVPEVLVVPCHTGSTAEALLRPLRTAPGLIEDAIVEHSFLEQQQIIDSPYGENRHYWKGHFVHELPDELIDELLERLITFGRAPVHVLIESLHGAPKEVDPTLGPVAFRPAAFNVSATGVWTNVDEDGEHIAWARDTAAAIEPWSIGGGYANYMQADEPLERVRAAFGDEAFERLQRLKRRYDPSNVLRRNQNIPPAEA
jgi:FAD/FMN-containing dehydrogenase